MTTQKITTPIKPFLNDGNKKYFKHPVNGEIYSMPTDKNTAYDLITGMPLSAFWLCSEVQFENYKSVFITGR